MPTLRLVYFNEGLLSSLSLGVTFSANHWAEKTINPGGTFTGMISKLFSVEKFCKDSS